MKPSKIKLVIIMGGKSPEHNISIESGKNVIENLDKEKYDIKPLIITKEGKWVLKDGYNYTLNELEKINPISPGKGILLLESAEPDIVFIALHGPNGEDGTLQGLFEILGIPYTGAGVCGNSIGIDKIKTHEILSAHKILMPEYIVIKKEEWQNSPRDVVEQIKRDLGLPCVIKPSNQGSSIGTTVAENEDLLENGLEECFKLSSFALIEKYIQGEEFSCSVLDIPHNGKYVSTALAVTKIVPKKSKFFSFDVKYEPGATDEITPAPIDKSLETKLKEKAIKVHNILCANPFSRIDFMFDGEKVYVLEINTIPGMTKQSIFPKACCAYGIEFKRALDIIIDYGLKKFRGEKFTST